MDSESNQAARCKAHYVSADGRRHACVFQQARHAVHAYTYVHAKYGRSFHDWRTLHRNNELRPLIMRRRLPIGPRWLLLTPDSALPYAVGQTWRFAVNQLHRWYREQREDNPQ